MRNPAHSWSTPMAAKGLSDERAAKFMVALREGKTPGMFGTRRRDVEAYCASNPEYARAALPLLEVNAKAAYSRKGAHLRDRTHCKHGQSRPLGLDAPH
jgi:hypothetical protein